VVNKGNKTANVTQGGGGLVKILHGVPGKYLDKTDVDPMGWRFERGKENRGIFYHGLGLQWKGVFTALRINQVRSKRYGTIEEGIERGLKQSKLETKFIFFSGEIAVSVIKAETLSFYGLDIQFDLIYEVVYPARWVLRVAEPNAYIDSMVQEAVIAITRQYSPEDFLTGPASADHQKELIATILTLGEEGGETEKALGIRITQAKIRGIDPEEDQREIFLLAEKTKRENAAAIAVAEKDKEVTVTRAKGQKEAGIFANDVVVDRITRTILPIAGNPGAIQLRGFEAYEENRSITVFAPGNPGGTSLIVNPLVGATTRLTPPVPEAGTP